MDKGYWQCRAILFVYALFKRVFKMTVEGSTIFDPKAGKSAKDVEQYQQVIAAMMVVRKRGMLYGGKAICGI